MKKPNQGDLKIRGVTRSVTQGKTAILFLVLVVVACFILETVAAELGDVGAVAGVTLGSLALLMPAWIARKYHRNQCRRMNSLADEPSDESN